MNQARKVMEISERSKFIQRLTQTPTIVLLSLSSPNLKRGMGTKGIQSNPPRSVESSQTDVIAYSEENTQTSFQSMRKKFASPLHFLKAAASTVSELINSNLVSQENSVSLFNIRKYPGTGDITQSLSDGFKTVVLSSSVTIYTGTSVHTLTHVSKTSAFEILSGFLVTGSTVGSLQLYDISTLDKKLVYPLHTTDINIEQNHKAPIVSIAGFNQHGTQMVAALDDEGSVSFWGIRNKQLTKFGETMRLSPCFLPTTVIKMAPNSASDFVVGAGSNIFHCSFYGSTLSPSVFHGPSPSRSISFNSTIPEIFASSFSNGHVWIFSRKDSGRLLDLSITNGNDGVMCVWSQQRGSVLFVSDSNGRLLIFDFLKKTHIPIETIKIGSAIVSLNQHISNGHTILTVSDCNGATYLYQVKDSYSTKLTNSEAERLQILLESLSL